MTTEGSYADRIREYLRLAEEARRSALKAKDLQAKQSFETIAVSWQQLAEQVAQIAGEHKKR
jgi:hypothetical protein